MSSDICGYETGNGPCKNPAGDDGTCYLESHEPDDYSAAELRAMGPKTADEELTAEQYDEWMKWQDLDQQADENKAELENEAEQAVETLVKADMGAITNTIDVHGNQIEVAVTLDRKQKRTLSRLEDEYEGIDDAENPTEEDIERMESMFADFFAVMFREFNGVDLVDEPEQSEAIGRECVGQWGLRASMYALVQIIEATEAADKELMESVESFRTETGGGRD